MLNNKKCFYVIFPVFSSFLPLSFFTLPFVQTGNVSVLSSSFQFRTIESRTITDNQFENDFLSFPNVSISNKIINAATDDQGYIHDVDLYVALAHSSYVLEDNGYVIPNYCKKYMGDTSVFVSNLGSEGNCVLNATYSMFDNMARHGWNTRFSDDYEGHTRYSTFFESDPLYDSLQSGSIPHEDGQTWRENDWKCHDDSTTYAIDYMSCLYLNIRRKAIELGYTVDGFPFYYTGELFRRSASLGGYSIGVSSSPSFGSWAEDNIENNVPVVVTAGSSSVYNDHGMCIYGYKKYHSTVTDGEGNTHQYTQYMFLIDDGYDSEVRWYDPATALANYYFSCSRSSLVFSVC